MVVEVKHNSYHVKVEAKRLSRIDSRKGTKEQHFFTKLQ